MGKIYVVGNFKGGVGKTKLVTMLAYETSQRQKKKTLVVDMDPQGNATRVLAKTGALEEVDKSITVGFEEGDLQKQIIPILPDLDLIPANTTFRNLSRILLRRFPEDEEAQIFYLKELLAPIRDLYDTIYIDVPPTISDYSDNAMLSADYCIIVLQTQELSLDGVKTYIGYMQYLSDKYHSGLNVLGIVPMMLRPGGRVDQKVLSQAEELYGANVLSTIIKYQERLKVYDVEGISPPKSETSDTWDIKAHRGFLEVLEELDAHEKMIEDYFKKERSADGDEKESV